MQCLTVQPPAGTDGDGPPAVPMLAAPLLLALLLDKMTNDTPTAGPFAGGVAASVCCTRLTRGMECHSLGS